MKLSPRAAYLRHGRGTGAATQALKADPQVKLVALGDAGYRAFAPDLRGYGGSSAPKEVAEYGSDKLTGDLCGLLDHYGYDRAAFVGHDWGAMVVWEMGRLHPQRVEHRHAGSNMGGQARRLRAPALA